MRVLSENGLHETDIIEEGQLLKILQIANDMF